VSIAPLDWVVGGVLLLSLLLGAWRGLVYEVLSVLGWFAAFMLAPWLAPDAAAWLPMGGASEAVRYAAGYVLVFIGVLFASGLTAWLTSKLVAAVGLRPIDRTLGALFGMVRGVLLVLALAVVVLLTPLKTAGWWTGSITSGIATAGLRGLKPLVPEAFGQYLPG
jgi:membrane protein required for colicin V production